MFSFLNTVKLSFKGYKNLPLSPLCVIETSVNSFSCHISRQITEDMTSVSSMLDAALIRGCHGQDMKHSRAEGRMKHNVSAWITLKQAHGK